MKQRCIVILVDHKVRDLLGATLMAHHVEARGIKCHLEPLESTLSCLVKHQPDLILFNHLTAPHLVRYSKRLKELNVLNAVLPNEGISYDEEVMRFNAGGHHKGAHIDLFFCWNEAHKQAIQEQMPSSSFMRLEVCGVPRFDFYFKPWSDVFSQGCPARGKKPKILVCTNFAYARYDTQSEADKKRFFSQFAVIPVARDYHGNIAASSRARTQFLVFLEALARSTEFEITLRPHPREEASWYAEHIKSFPEEARSSITIDSDSVVTALMQSCDLEIACETCTTSMEAWMSGKPAIELVFERNPIFFHEQVSRLNTLCDDPAQIVETVRHELNDAQGHVQGFSAGRREHLRKWCSSPDGHTSERVAEILCEAVKAKEPMSPNFTLSERRKGLKLKLTNAFDIRYNFSPMLSLKTRLMPKDYATKYMAYRKIIRPSDVREAREKLNAVIRNSNA